MKCVFTITGPDDAQGWRDVTCVRCGLTARSPHAPEKIHADCRSPVWIGLGDAVAWITGRTGIDAWWKRRAAARGQACGCGKRQAALNRAVPLPGRLRGFLAYLRLWKATRAAG